MTRLRHLKFKTAPQDAFDCYAVPMIEGMNGEVLAVDVNNSSRVVYVTILLAADSVHRRELLECLTAWQHQFEIDLHPTLLEEC